MKIRLATLIIPAVLTLISGCQSTPTTAEQKALTAAKVNVQRNKTLDMSKKGLDLLYSKYPEIRAELESAVGYGVFDVTTINAILVVGAEGSGVIVDNTTKAPTYMKVARLGTGPGIGYEEIYQIFVFKSKEALDQFKVGGKGGGDVNVSISAGKYNKEFSINPTISVYQINEKGFAVQANWGGTAYLVDSKLN